ncbi:hypothetical protein HYPBUDRAFT_149147 [Hyphopichia burtonii NRRL Y-1933]|uniref:RFX-type winged-helix domain-containing protein n=1 Tax=Hyphopichia burtonii NRRL Y-1933 TaxID=984485 RepID=A0A1E4RGD4_9ASCO|nr:hypothetical protein HYPBUDRAFT_149147 [Hyphopichia burtonii NRRL Y-1933]ODV66271.1 hypothetical protein HYPBUDRAFT_149147 [Hyphopichia burtonii NRRL Y-1933]
MSNKPPATAYPHKRQKSSLLNAGYYFSDSTTSTTPQQSNNQNPPPHTVPNTHTQHSNASPTIDESIYDNEDPYNPLNYSFPPNQNSSQQQLQHEQQTLQPQSNQQAPSSQQHTTIHHSHSLSAPQQLSAPSSVGPSLSQSARASPVRQPLSTSTAAPTTALNTTHTSAELAVPSSSNNNSSSATGHMSASSTLASLPHPLSSSTTASGIGNSSSNNNPGIGSSLLHNNHHPTIATAANSFIEPSHNHHNSIPSNPASASTSFFYPSHYQNSVYGSSSSDPPYAFTSSFNNNNNNNNSGGNSMLESNLYQSFTYPRISSHSTSNTTHPNYYEPNKYKHSKNNLSISSHFNFINLNDNQGPTSNLGTSSLGNTNSFASPSVITDPKRYGSALPPTLPPAPPPQSTANIINELIMNLASVDGSNINNYLLTILYKLNFPLPIDDFYNLLYNNDKLASLMQITLPQKIDKTLINSTIPNASVDVINQLLNVFKKPDSLGNFYPNLINKENKLMNINYHELLRTFLAIKILFDILIQIPMNSPDEPQNYTIPRLSIYKTYYIICQKLILQYPSSSNTTNEQQKLILGQSKLGKLIKLVYPNLMIKRLGSRGESKYNYLGVIWNDNIVNEEVKDLCNNNELLDLNDIFNGQRKQQQQQQQQHPHLHHHSHHRRKSSRISVSSSRRKRSFDDTNQLESIVSPELSFIQSTNKFPSNIEFTVLSTINDHNKSGDPNSNWFDLAKFKIYSKLSQYNITFVTIEDVFLNNVNMLEKDSLLKNLFSRIIHPLVESVAISSESNDGEISEEHQNVDLNLYLIIIIELLPYLLLIKSSTEINFLKNLRYNLLYLISNLEGELSRIDENEVFSHKNSSIFLLILKKLINLNDLLITFIKLIIKDNSVNKSAMAVDIENFFVDANMSKKPYDNSRNSSVSDDLLGRSSVSSSSATLTSNRIEDHYQDPFNMNFKNILSSDLIYTLIGYNFDPTLNNELKSSISLYFINQEINLIDNFFKKDLLNFLTNDNETIGNEIESDIADEIHKDSMILSAKELKKLNSLIYLIDTKLLSENFKSKYPILVYNNYINFILNDLLKYIFIKQQQQISSQSSQDNKNSFGNWWVFNSFIQEYLSLLGEIVGLSDLL